MASWKKILVEGDNTNLGTSNLTQSTASRTYTVSGAASNLSINSHHGGTLAQFVSGNVNAGGDFVSFNSGAVELSGSVSSGAAVLRLKEASNNGGNYIGLTVPSIAATYTVTLPGSSPGGNNKILESDSSGNLSWISTPSGGGGSTTINNNADNRVITGSGTADTLEGEANLTYDGTNLAVASGGVHLDNNQSLSAKNTSGSPRILARADGSNVAVFNAGFTQTLIGGASGITLSGPVTAESIIQQHDNVSSEGDFGAGADITFLGSSGTSTILGRVYYYDGSTWQIFSPATEAAQKALLGIALGSTMASGFLLKGFIHPSSGTLTTAVPVFAHATNGSFQSAAPSSGFQRVLGHAISTSAIYFNPSQEYIDIT